MIFREKMGFENQWVTRVFFSPSLTPSVTFLDKMGKKGDIFPLESVRDEAKKGEGWKRPQKTIKNPDKH